MMSGTHANSGSFRKGDTRGVPFRFQEGHKTWNKGVSVHLSPDSEWKDGDTAGERHPQWKGGEQHMKHDCVHVYGGVNVRLRRPRVVYEKAFGKIPFGHVIWHKDGDKENDAPENLEAIPRAEALKRNNRDGGRWKAKVV